MTLISQADKIWPEITASSISAKLLVAVEV
jgi:hypothetical protein